MDQKLALLAKVPLFADLKAKDLKEVGRLADEVSVPAGKVLVEQGSRAEEFFVILDGTVRIDRDGRHVRDLGPGEFFGEIALLGKIGRTASATSTTPARMIVVAHREFISLLSGHPSIQEAILYAVAKRISALEPDRAH